MFQKELRRLTCAAMAIAGLGLAAPAASQGEFTPPYTTQCSGGQAKGPVPSLQKKLVNRWAFQFEEEDITSPFSCAHRGPTVNPVFALSPEALEALGAVDGVRRPEYVFAGGE
jgi:hypothetical protein